MKTELVVQLRLKDTLLNSSKVTNLRSFESLFATQQGENPQQYAG